MSSPIVTESTPVSEYHSLIGTPPGTQDAKAECKDWERLCGELLAERERLRAELAQSQRERQAYLKSLYRVLCKDYQPNFDRDVAFAQLDDHPTMHELIAELEHAQEK